MQNGKSGMGTTKHRTSGHSSQSPKFRFLTKLEAEKNEKKDNSRLRDPKSSIKELFSSKNRTKI